MNTNRIGIIGAGAIGKAFTVAAAKAGYEVLLSNSRGPESLENFVKSIAGNVRAVTTAEAAKADIIFLSVQWQHVETVIKSIGDWESKIIIDPTNPVLPGFTIPDLRGKNSSEIIEGLAKGGKVVKAFNTLPPSLLSANPNEGGGKRVIFYSGNNSKANEVVGGIISKLGFGGIDLGKLNTGGMLQVFPGGPLPTHNLIKL